MSKPTAQRTVDFRQTLLDPQAGAIGIFYPLDLRAAKRVYLSEIRAGSRFPGSSVATQGARKDGDHWLVRCFNRNHADTAHWLAWEHGSLVPSFRTGRI